MPTYNCLIVHYFDETQIRLYDKYISEKLEDKIIEIKLKDLPDIFKNGFVWEVGIDKICIL